MNWDEYARRMAEPSPLGERCPRCCEPVEFCEYWDWERGTRPSDCLLRDAEPYDEDGTRP